LLSFKKTLILFYSSKALLIFQRAKASRLCVRFQRGEPIDDIEGADIIESAIQREIAEEVKLGARYTKKLIGFINDDSNDVGKVHFGLLYLVDLKSPRISVSDDEKDVNEGSLIKISEVGGYTEFMENWSRIAFNAIRKRK